jgi:hypothetical protein
MRTCRICGCDDLNACEDALGAPCFWVTRDLCSECADMKRILAAAGPVLDLPGAAAAASLPDSWPQGGNLVELCGAADLTAAIAERRREMTASGGVHHA